MGVLCGDGFDRRQNVFHQGAQIKSFGIDLNSAGFNLRKVENVVDDRQKVPAGAMDLPDVPQLFGLTQPFKLFFQHLAVADDRVQRSTQLMAHIGKESTLRAACLLGHFFGLPQAFLRFGEGFGAFLGSLAAFAAFPIYLAMRGAPTALEVAAFAWLTAGQPVQARA